MSSSKCAEHSSRTALYQCDGCDKMLCPDCIEEGHRLLFCKHCGEMAVPLDRLAPSTSPSVKRQRKLDAPYSLRDALFYPFGGLGAYLYFGYVGLSLSFSVLGLLPLGGCLAAVFSLMIVWLLPGLLFSIVRTSARGEMELPEWPDWFDFGERFADLFATVLVCLVAVLPLSLLLRAADCDIFEYLSGSWSSACWAVVLVGGTLAIIIWIVAFGAIGVYENWFYGARVDLHVRALFATSPDSWKVIALVTGLLLGSQFLRFLFLFVPLIGTIMEVVIGIYAMFLAMHLIGLHFRKYSQLLENIYL